MALDPNWDPETALRDLKDPIEVSLYDGESPADTARRILKENAPLVAKSLVYLAVNSPNERVRLQAGIYVMDRNLGRISDAGPLFADHSDPLMKLLTEISSSVPGIKNA